MTKDEVMKAMIQASATIWAGMQANPNGGVDIKKAVEDAMYLIEMAETYAESWQEVVHDD